MASYYVGCVHCRINERWQEQSNRMQREERIWNWRNSGQRSTKNKSNYPNT